jgi:hypothetical protein
MANKTLGASLPKLQADLLKILQKAAFEAYKTQLNAGTADGGVQARMDAKLNAAALKFSQKFAQEAAQPMAKAIYDFTMEIGINATNVSTVISPHGPCTGAIPMNNFKVV